MDREGTQRAGLHRHVLDRRMLPACQSIAEIPTLRRAISRCIVR
jgi:hypothetical protein